MASQSGPTASPQVAYETDVLVVGGGPVGMLMAYQLGRQGISCMLVEQGTRTTAHPKMELLSARSMEIMRDLGLHDRLRAVAIPEKFPSNEVFSTGLSRKEGHLRTLERDSPAVFREKWLKDNDGSHPREPYLRISQIIFEAWLKPIFTADPRIDSHWGWTFQTLVEREDHVLSTIVNEWGKEVVVKSRFVVGCDGAGSKVRGAVNLEAKRKPTSLNVQTVHFRSRDLDTLHSQGRFWHLNLLSGSLVISQDEVEIFTYHQMLHPGEDTSSIEPMELLRNGLGGIGEPCDIKVEQILKTAIWKSNLSIADSFCSVKGNVFLAGDAAHQLTPAGGNGLNSGISDTYDLSWKLASVLKGYGGKHVLESYDHERRLVALNNVKRGEEALGALIPMLGYAAHVGYDVIHAENEAGRKARSDLSNMIERTQWVHAQQGTWVDYRYYNSQILVGDPTGSEPARSVTEYVPSTWPGCRAPHVYLSDGTTSTFDLYGPDFNVVDFTAHGEISLLFVAVARGMGIPIKRIHLPSEQHAHTIWQRDAVLLRPDGHVAWRAPADGTESLTISTVRKALSIATGRIVSPDYAIPAELQEEVFQDVAPEERIQKENEAMPEVKTGTIEQFEGEKGPAMANGTSLPLNGLPTNESAEVLAS